MLRPIATGEPWRTPALPVALLTFVMRAQLATTLLADAKPVLQ